MRSQYKLKYQHKKLYNTFKVLESREILNSLGPLKNKKNSLWKLKLRYKRIKLTEKNYTIYKKSSVILRLFVGQMFHVHDGLFLQRLELNRFMVNFKFGQFIFTKRLGLYIHKDNKIAKKKAKLLKQLAAKSLAKKMGKGKKGKKR